jgi:intein/homing endonuclease
MMSSLLARNATMTYNLTHNVIGASKEDLANMGEYLEFGLDNLPPYLTINRTGNDWTKEVVLGTRNINNQRDVHARIRITNVDDGKTRGSLKTAGGTPYTSIYDEVGKFPVLGAWLAGRPAHMMHGRMRGVCLMAGCCCAGTIVYKSNGEPCRIEDLKQEDGIIGFDNISSKAVSQDITWMKPPAEKECYRITTKRGRVLECSGDHPILTVVKKRKGKFRYFGSDFRRADSLRVGRKICVSDGVDIWGDKKMFDPYLVGILIGDGSYGFDKTPIVSTSDDEVYDYIRSKYECCIEKQYKTKDGKDYREIRIKGICHELRELGIYGQTKKNKTLPLNIHSYRREDVIMMIRGYFDADATFYSNNNNRDHRISLGSCNRHLLEEVKDVLFKFGIHSTISYSPSKNPADRSIILDSYVCNILDKLSMLKYCDIIGTDIGYRREKLDSIRKFGSNFSTFGSFRSKYLDGVIIERIDKIEYIGIKPVYNLTASDTHTYIANGIITHNTGGNVEKSQDAQKIMNSPDEYGFIIMNYDILNKRVIKPTWRICKSGCFVPAQMSHAYEKKETTLDKYLGVENAPGLKKIKIKVSDFDKNTGIIKSRLDELVKKDRALYVQERMAFPLSIDDCFLNTNVNRFPVEDALKHKSRLLEEGRPGKTVDIYQIDGMKMGYNFSDKQLADYPFQGGNIDSPVVIYEDPPEEGGVFDYTYVSSLDPYKSDKADTDSVGSFYVLKRYVKINDPFAYCIVASYASRPPSSDDFCRNCEILQEAYGAKCLMENADRMYEFYLTRRNKQLMLLEDGERLAGKIIRAGARQNNKLGLAPTVPNQRMLFNTVIQYCWEDVVVGYDDDGNEITQKGIYRIPDIELLDEIIAFGPGTNTDRIIAFGHALLLAKYYDDMGYMPESTTQKENQKKRERRKTEQVKGFTVRRHNPYKMR